MRFISIIIVMIVYGCAPNKDMSSWPEPDGVVTSLSSRINEPLLFARAVNEVIKDKRPASWQNKQAELLALSKVVITSDKLLGKIKAIQIDSNDWLVHIKNIGLLTELIKNSLIIDQNLTKKLSELLLFEVKFVSPTMLRKTSEHASGMMDEALLLKQTEGANSNMLLLSLVEFLLAAKDKQFLSITQNLAQQFSTNITRLKNLSGISSSLSSKIDLFAQDLLEKWQLIESALLTLEQRSDFHDLSKEVQDTPLKASENKILAQAVLLKIRNHVKNIGFLINHDNDDEIVENILVLNNFQVISIDVKEFINKSKQYRDGISWFKLTESLEWLAKIINNHTTDITNPIIILKNISLDNESEETITSVFDQFLDLIKKAQVIIPANKNYEYLLKLDSLKDGMLGVDVIDSYTAQKIINHMVSLDHTIVDYKDAFRMLAKVGRALSPENFSTGAFLSLIENLLKQEEIIKNTGTFKSSSALNTATKVVADEFNIKDYLLVDKIYNLSNTEIEQLSNDTLKKPLNSDQNLSMKASAINELVSKINRENLNTDTISIDEARKETLASATIAEKQALLTKESASQTMVATAVLNQAVQTAKDEAQVMITKLKEEGENAISSINQLSTSKTADINEKLANTKDTILQKQRIVTNSFTKEASEIIKDFEKDIATKKADIDKKQKSLVTMMKESIGLAGEAVGSSLLNEAKLKFEEQKNDLVADAQRTLSKTTEDLQKRFDQSLSDLRKNNQWLEDRNQELVSKVKELEGNKKPKTELELLSDETTKELIAEYEKALQEQQRINRLIKDRNRELQNEIKLLKREEETP